ncbi:MOONR protein, partial [Tricholaema leucomelas]|nr:MOONR protein [Tricholaema leucomelas]
MGASKPAVSDGPFAFTSQLYRNEAKALQTQLFVFYSLQQLQFNRNVPAAPENLALRFSNPPPIIIEKLKASHGQRNLTGTKEPSIRSSSMFSVVSEERLKLAVQLAKRDIKRRHLEEQLKQQVFGAAVNKSLLAQKLQQQKSEAFESPENKNALKSQPCMKYQQKLSQPSKVETTSSGAKVYLYTPNRGKLIPAALDSSPAHDTKQDPKPNRNRQEEKNMQEVRQLHKELRSYVQKIEEVTKKGREREILDPDEEQRVCARREKQAARSARMLYVLQQQVKEIQDDLEKLSTHKIKHTKKSRAVSRLAAAHRGAVRALHSFANHFADQAEQQVPAHYRELGSLIRQLSLCSAKLEGDSSISDIIIDILLQVEDLESLLEKKQTPKKVKKCIAASQGKSPSNTETLPARKQPPSPKGEHKPLTLKGQQRQEPRKPAAARTLLPGLYFELLNPVQKSSSCAHVLHNEFPEGKDPPTPETKRPPCSTLPGSKDALVRAGAAKKDPSLDGGPLKKKGMSSSAKLQGVLKSPQPRRVQPSGKRARFQEPTIAFQLKETQRPAKESRVPCVPPRPAPPPVAPQRYVQHLHQPPLPCSPLEMLLSAMLSGVALAWLSDHAGRWHGMAELTACLWGFKFLLSYQVSECHCHLLFFLCRSQNASPAKCADKVGMAAQNHLEPPADRTQVVQSSSGHSLEDAFRAQVTANADVLSEKLLDGLLEGTAEELWSPEQPERLQTEALPVADTHNLEAMLQRMEEIESYQEAVRRRFTQIVYSDLQAWDQGDQTEQQMASMAKRPASPHPIQLTKLNGHTEPEMDILLGKPFDGNDIDENKEAEENLQTGNEIFQPRTRNSLQEECCVALSVPKAMLQSISEYNNRYKQHLKLICHDAVGSFDPWQIAESLAEQLTEEALCDVAAELQDVCEDYAEAVFTSEFLQPAQ